METSNNNTNEVKKLHWGIKVLLFLAGQITASFSLAFIALTLRLNEPAAYGFLGIMIIVGSFIGAKLVNDEKIVYALVLPAYFDGIALMTAGFGKTADSFVLLCFLLLVVAVVSYFFVNNKFFRSILLLECFSLVPCMFLDVENKQEILSVIGLVYVVIYALTCLCQDRIYKDMPEAKDHLPAFRFSAQLVGFVLVFCNDIIIYKISFWHSRLDANQYFYDGIYNVDVLSVIYGVCALALAVYWISDYMGKPALVPILLCLVVCALSTFYRPIILSVLCAILGFWVKERKCWILSLLLLTGSTIFYYYNTNFTLLNKSYSLMVLGVVFLLCGYYIVKQEKVSQNKKELL